MTGAVFRWNAAVAIAFFGLVVATLVSAETPADVLDRHSISGQDRRRVESVFDRAESLDIPTDLLIPRLQEGLAKGVPIGRLATALVEDLDAYVSARVILSGSSRAAQLLSDNASWARTATLLDVPLSPDEILTLAVEADGDVDGYRSGSALYVSLRQWGLDRLSAMAISTAALKSGLPTSDYLGVLDVVVRGRQLRMPIDRLVERIVLLLPEVGRLRTLERAVLK